MVLRNRAKFFKRVLCLFILVAVAIVCCAINAIKYTSSLNVIKTNTSASIVTIRAETSLQNGNDVSTLNKNLSVDNHYKIIEAALPPVILLQIYVQDSPTKTKQNYSCANNTMRAVQSGDLNMLRNDAHAVMFLGNFGDHYTPKAVKKLIEISNEQEAAGSDQLWIFNSHESAFHARFSRRNVRPLPVHTIASYHWPSGIHVVSGHYQPGQPTRGYGDPQTALRSLNALMKRKTKFATWVSSHCSTNNWPRADYINWVQRHMKIDLYGKCGNLTCEPRLSSRCQTEVFIEYKFIFALENSECEDYITEKMWNALIIGIVPVVYGPRKASYIRMAPPNSFIYAGDFNSTKELADYLVYLDKNPDEYRKYFEWRSKGTAKKGNPPNARRFCNIPELIRQVSLGQLGKQPLIDTPFYNSCNVRDAHLLKINGRIEAGDWVPWK